MKASGATKVQRHARHGGTEQRPWLSLLTPRLLFEMGLVLVFLVHAANINPSVDFLAFYTAGEHVLTGNADNLFDLDALVVAQDGYEILGDGLFPFWYPPIYAALFAPLALLSMPVARVIWGLLAFLAARVALERSIEWSRVGGRGTMLLLAFPPLWIALVLGQMSPFTLLIFTAIAWLTWRGRVGVTAGVLAGIALYKPQLLFPLLLLWLFQREWHALAGFIGTGLVILVGSLMVSPEAVYDYFFLTPQMMPLMQEELAARGTVTSLATILGLWLPVGLSVVVALAALIGTMLLAWRRSPTHHHHALLWFSVVLATPYLGHYDLMLLLLPVTFLVPALAKDRLLAGGVALLALSFVPWARGGGMVPPVLAAGLLFAASSFRIFSASPPCPRTAEIAAGVEATTAAVGGPLQRP